MLFQVDIFSLFYLRNLGIFLVFILLLDLTTAPKTEIPRIEFGFEIREENFEVFIVLGSFNPSEPRVHVETCNFSQPSQLTVTHRKNSVISARKKRCHQKFVRQLFLSQKLS